MLEGFLTKFFLGVHAAEGFVGLLGEQLHQLIADQRLVVFDLLFSLAAGDFQGDVGLVELHLHAGAVVAHQRRDDADVHDFRRGVFALFLFLFLGVGGKRQGQGQQQCDESFHRGHS